MDIFNNREIATGIWFVIFAIWSFSKAEVRGSFKGVLNAFATTKIIIPFVLIIIYVSIIIWCMDSAGLWKSHQVKNTTYWFFSVAAVSFFRLSDMSEDPHYFKNAIKDNLKIIIILEFIISLYSFSLIVELIFVPFVTLLTIMMVISEHDAKHKAVELFLNYLLGTIGLFLILFTMFKLYSSFSEIAQEKTFYDITVPILLSLLVLPYFYILHVYVSYENVFIRLLFSIKEKKLETYAKNKSILNFGVNVTALKRWAHSLNTLDINSKTDVNNSIDEINKLIQEEKNPPVVSETIGWSPYQANVYLDEEGLKTGYYNGIYGEWFANSPYLEIGGDILPNNIAYYLEGEKHAVKRLILKMNINNKDNSQTAHQKLLEIARKLCIVATNNNLPEILDSAILNGDNQKLEDRLNTIYVLCNPLGNDKGYDVKFVIEKT